MEYVVNLLISHGVGWVFATFMGYIAYRYKSDRTADKALQKGVQSLLRNTILDKHEQLVAIGHCPNYAKTNIDHMYKSYKSLGGNGVVEQAVVEILSLPSVERADSQESLK